MAREPALRSSGAERRAAEEGIICAFALSAEGASGERRERKENFRALEKRRKRNELARH